MKDFIIEGGVLMKYFGCYESTLFVPDGIEKIGANCFAEDNTITTVVIPPSVKSIEYAAFFGCTKLTDIVFLGDSNLESLADACFQNCFSLVSCRLPNGVKEIPANAFKSCYSLRQFEIPSNVKAIGTQAFSECTGLINLSFPKGLETIGERAFYACESLLSVSFPEELKEIKEGAFIGCTELKEIVIPKNIKTIHPFTFASCEGLEKVSLPAALEVIKEGAFDLCTGLTEILSYPQTEQNKLRKIEQKAFSVIGVYSKLELNPAAEGFAEIFAAHLFADVCKRCGWEVEFDGYHSYLVSIVAPNGVDYSFEVEHNHYAQCVGNEYKAFDSEKLTVQLIRDSSFEKYRITVKQALDDVNWIYKQLKELNMSFTDNGKGEKENV